MANDSWCRHYNGVGNSETCKIGVLYSDVVAKCEGKPNTWPCFDPTVRDRCSSFEGYTREEIEEDDRKVAAFVAKLNDFAERKTDDCPHCGKKMTSVRQVGRCVYGSCGCRIYQGRVPKAWQR